VVAMHGLAVAPPHHGPAHGLATHPARSSGFADAADSANSGQADENPETLVVPAAPDRPGRIHREVTMLFS